jgi:hypothetical protein
MSCGRLPSVGRTCSGQHALLVVQAASEDDAGAMFTDDPWADSILRIEGVEPRTLWVGADTLPPP